MIPVSLLRSSSIHRRIDGFASTAGGKSFDNRKEIDRFKFGGGGLDMRGPIAVIPFGGVAYARICGRTETKLRAKASQR